MKGLTKELRQSSIDKWLEIEGRLVDKIDFDYERKYWEPCGFCKALGDTRDCIGCSLYKRKKGKLICSEDEKEISHAYLALRCADGSNFDKALIHCRIVLKKIRSTRIDTKIKGVKE